MASQSLAAVGISALSGTKRKAEELGEYALPAVVGDISARIVSVAVGRYEARASEDDQLARLRTLLIMVHSAVEAAERVHIASWWLRRWLWALRDAALEGDEVLRLFRSRQLRAAEEEEEKEAASRQQQQAGAGSTLWNAAARALRSARSLLLPLLSRDDDPTLQLRRALAALEREAKGLGGFLTLLDLEIRTGHNSTTLEEEEEEEEHVDAASVEEEEEEENDDDEEEEHIAAGTTNMGLRGARRASACLLQDKLQLQDLVAEIQQAAVYATRHVDLRGNRNSWLDKWHRELLAVAGRAERVLLALPTKAARYGADDVGEEVRRTVQSVEAAAAHVKDFVTLVKLAQRQTQTPQRRGGRGIIREWFSRRRLGGKCICCPLI